MTNPLKGVTFPGLAREFQIPNVPEDIGAAPAEAITPTGTNGIVSTPIGVTDANDLPAGVWKGNNLTNAPAGFVSWVLYQTYYYNAAHDNAWQIAYTWTAPGAVMMRTKTSLGWGAWHSLAPAVGDEWDSSATYAVGDYCIYHNSLYKCKTQNTGQAPTNTTYWTATTVAYELHHINDITKPTLTAVAQSSFTATGTCRVSGKTVELRLSATALENPSNYVSVLSGAPAPAATRYMMVPEYSGGYYKIRVGTDGVVSYFHRGSEPSALSAVDFTFVYLID